MYCSSVLTGGLGNQLFQLCTLLAYCYDTGRTPVLPSQKNDDEPIDRPLYWESPLLSHLKQFVVPELPFPGERITEKSNLYTELPRSRESVVELKGDFQSPKYFEHHLPKILRNIHFHDYRDFIYRKYRDRFVVSEGERTVSLHFRIGDYLHQQCYHHVLPVDYYLDAFARLFQSHPETRRWRILCFHEQADEDRVNAYISQFYSAIPSASQSINIEKFRGDSAMEEMIAMTLCHDHIVANSTFSWWGAYLDPKTDSTVICPSIWYGHQLFYIKTTDLVPTHWIRGNCPPVMHHCPVLSQVNDENNWILLYF
jgi:hypothetical protein